MTIDWANHKLVHSTLICSSHPETNSLEITPEARLLTRDSARPQFQTVLQCVRWFSRSVKDSIIQMAEWWLGNYWAWVQFLSVLRPYQANTSFVFWIQTLVRILFETEELYFACRNADREACSRFISASESRNARVDSAPWFRLIRSSWSPSQHPPVDGS